MFLRVCWYLRHPGAESLEPSTAAECNRCSSVQCHGPRITRQVSICSQLFMYKTGLSHVSMLFTQHADLSAAERDAALAVFVRRARPSAAAEGPAHAGAATAGGADADGGESPRGVRHADAPTEHTSHLGRHLHAKTGPRRRCKKRAWRSSRSLPTSRRRHLMRVMLCYIVFSHILLYQGSGHWRHGRMAARRHTCWRYWTRVYRRWNGTCSAAPQSTNLKHVFMGPSADWAEAAAANVGLGGVRRAPAGLQGELLSPSCQCGGHRE